MTESINNIQCSFNPWGFIVFFFFLLVSAQVQHIVIETRDKIMQYKSKMVDEADLRRRLAILEESVELHEHMKRQVTRLHLVIVRERLSISISLS